MKGSSVGQKLKRNVRENNRIFTLKQRRSVRCFKNTLFSTQCSMKANVTCVWTPS